MNGMPTEQMGMPIDVAAELVDAWETGGKGYGDLEQRIEQALVRVYNEGWSDGRLMTMRDGWTQR